MYKNPIHFREPLLLRLTNILKNLTIRIFIFRASVQLLTHSTMHSVVSYVKTRFFAFVVSLIAHCSLGHTYLRFASTSLGFCYIKVASPFVDALPWFLHCILRLTGFTPKLCDRLIYNLGVGCNRVAEKEDVNIMPGVWNRDTSVSESKPVGRWSS